ncbi:hypothetical protein F53441_3678 [Fusarium austroafricanum]|uniref:G domain-containing protein n=1 Tax=Fusarium austroafricanum TaxID=2364996 RepID=A0A8H4KQC6_9HYPO|nr:hypothetical protein F53441_3678 [Fusarium austroafricanum]
MNEHARPSFGQQVAVGTLYDARLDQFLPSSILPPNPPQGAIVRFPPQLGQEHHNWHAAGSRHIDRFCAMGINHNLTASILSGLIDPKGSATFLKDGISSQDTFYGVVGHIFKTCVERISLREPVLRNVLAHKMFLPADDRATHVVTGIKWGLQSIMTMEHHIDNPNQRMALKTSFSRDLAELHAIVQSIDALDFSDNSASNRLQLEYDFMLYADTQRDNGIYQQGLPVMCKFVQLGPEQIRSTNGGKGYPISYTLMPVDQLRRFMPDGARLPNGPRLLRTVANIVPLLTLFDDLNMCKEKLEDYRHSLLGKEQYLDKRHIHEVDDAVVQLDTFRKDLQRGLQKIVAGIKDGTIDNNRIQQLHASYGSHAQGISMIAGQQSDKLKFIQECVHDGATYIGFNGACVNESILSHDPPPYRFFFNNAVLKTSSSWNDRRTALRNFLHNPNNHNHVFIIDCDAPSEYRDLEGPSFGPIGRNTTPVSDVSEYHEMPTECDPLGRQPEAQRQLNKCFAYYEQGALSGFNTRAPIESRPVKIPCPGRYCDPQPSHEWTCIKCDAAIEFGVVDDYIYCDCGRAYYDAWKFKCNGEDHGSDFNRPSSRYLGRLLKRLDRPVYRNILVLGETGVGKSTFINSFVNFLKFVTFDEAKAFKELVYAVPCSFSINGWDSEKQEMENLDISIGSRDDEHDGTAGDSATQKTSVYPVTYGNTTYRLIDTPGIGDTRGPEQDKKNIRDIMNKLRSYEELHGILILLKTDQARLTATFKFCFEELLSHLHRSAVANIAFGFTQTLASNYVPGQSYGLLQRLLKDHTTVGFTLSRANTYCFDAASFHYLAAYHQTSREKDDRNSRESWEKSRTETFRLLSHVDNIKPHQVRQTLSMDDAREALSYLIIPMVQISQEIRKNLTLLDDKKKELNDTRLSGHELRKRLLLDRIEVVPKKLAKPRTVCKNKKCCEFKSNLNDEIVPVYKTICHDDCNLRGVTEECVGHPELINCRAFKKDKKSCSNCQHGWQEHMHYLYELKERKVQVKDDEIERRLRANATDVALRKDGIQRVEQLQREYSDERNLFRKATAQFVAYLKEHSVKAINDATEEYYNQLIKNEEDNIQLGKDNKMNVDANKKKLKGLIHDRNAHLELVDAIKENMHAPRHQMEEILTDDGVEKLIRELYSLKHFGKNLKLLKDDIEFYDKGYSERPHHRRRSRSRKPRCRSVDSDVYDSSGPACDEPERESGGRRGIFKGINKFLSDLSIH